MSRVRTGLVAALAALALGPAAGPAPAVSSPAWGSPAQVIELKTCGPGFKKAVIDGQEKCLRRGQFCKRSADRQYRRYGYKCVRDRAGRYRLQPA